MIKEINKAVEIFHRIAFGTKNNAKKLPETKLAAFVSELTKLLEVRYEKNWYPENPNKGSGYRCIRVNGQSIDPTIVKSLKLAKIELSKDLIITELTVWVDPGVVSVRIGEDGSIGSEIVDEVVYNISKQTKDAALKRSALESDEGFSSRSSTPESSISESSRSASPSTNSSIISTQHSASPSPIMEFNPYSPPVQVTYPSIYQRSATPLSVQPSQRNPSPQVSQLQLESMRTQRRPMIPFGSTMVSTHNIDLFNQASYVTSSSGMHAAAYNRPRALFSTQENSTSLISHDATAKIAFNPYHAMSLMYGAGLQPTNFCDIPAMA